jgi:hypothetical protein
LDFLDQLDDPNFNPFATKASVVNDGEQLPVSKSAGGGGGGGYNLDFLDKADLDDPNFNPFETKTKVVLDDPNFNPFETKSKVVLDDDDSSNPILPTSKGQ